LQRHKLLHGMSSQEIDRPIRSGAILVVAELVKMDEANVEASVVIGMLLGETFGVI